MPRMGSDVGRAIGRRMASGKRVTVLVLRTLSESQLRALERELHRAGKRLPEGLSDELHRNLYRQRML